MTRNDISLSYQLPQTNHAVVQFMMEHPFEAKEWFTSSNTIVILAAKNLTELETWVLNLQKGGHKHSKFHEPDIGNELTAVALVPSQAAKKLCSKFKLAGRV